MIDRALEHGDHAILLVSGRVSYDGDSKELLNHKELGKVYDRSIDVGFKELISQNWYRIGQLSRLDQCISNISEKRAKGNDGGLTCTMRSIDLISLFDRFGERQPSHVYD